MFGEPRRIGFYNTFVAVPPDGPEGSATVQLADRELEVATHGPGEGVVALRGRGVASIQGHAESVLSRDGVLALHGLIRHALA